MNNNADTLWIVRLTNGSSVTTISEAVARENHAREAGSTLHSRPFPSQVKMPWIGDDYSFGERDGVDFATHLPTGVVGWGDDRRDAYKQMLRALRDHLERQTETLVSE